jgi:hypothetical protein
LHGRQISMKQGHLLACVGAILAGVLVWELVTPPTQDPDDAPRTARAAAVAGAGGESTAPESGAQAMAQAAMVALDRPLFSRDRRPGARGKDDGAAVAKSGALPRLSGIIVTPDRRFALFSDANGKSRGAVEGDAMDGYVIRLIQPEQIILSGPEGERVLRPAFAKPPGAEATAR